MLYGKEIKLLSVIEHIQYKHNHMNISHTLNIQLLYDDNMRSHDRDKLNGFHVEFTRYTERKKDK